MSVMTINLNGSNFHLDGSIALVVESLNWSCLHLSDGVIKTINEIVNLMWHVWPITGGKESGSCWLLLLLLATLSQLLLCLTTTSLENDFLGWKIEPLMEMPEMLICT